MLQQSGLFTVINATVPHFHCSVSHISTSFAPPDIFVCSPLKLLGASFLSIVLVSSCRLRSGAGPAADKRRGGAAAAAGVGDEQGGESEGGSQHANTRHVFGGASDGKKKEKKTNTHPSSCSEPIFFPVAIAMVEDKQLQPEPHRSENMIMTFSTLTLSSA